MVKWLSRGNGDMVKCQNTILLFSYPQFILSHPLISVLTVPEEDFPHQFMIHFDLPISFIFVFSSYLSPTSLPFSAPTSKNPSFFLFFCFYLFYSFLPPTSLCFPPFLIFLLVIFLSVYISTPLHIYICTLILTNFLPLTFLYLPQTQYYHLHLPHYHLHPNHKIQIINWIANMIPLFLGVFIVKLWNNGEKVKWWDVKMDWYRAMVKLIWWNVS